jgi:hypothetical protein
MQEGKQLSVAVTTVLILTIALLKGNKLLYSVYCSIIPPVQCSVTSVSLFV